MSGSETGGSPYSADSAEEIDARLFFLRRRAAAIDVEVLTLEARLRVLTNPPRGPAGR